MTVTPRADVELIAGYHSPQLDVAVRLNTNEAPDPPPAEWSERLAERVQSIAWNRYPDRSAGALRAGLADLHGVDPAQVFAANGSNEVLQTLLLAYGGPGRTAAVLEPTYALHSHIARITGTAVAEGERGEQFEVEVAELARLVDRARPSVIFLCSPNNPTGVVDPPDVVAAALDLARDHDALLVVDEAYGQFAPWSALDLVGDDQPLVVTRTYSKTWSMAAARLGYLVGPRWVVDQLEKVALPYHLDAVTQAAGTLALDYHDQMLERVGRLVAERRRLVDALGTLPVQVWPSGANFVLFRPLDGDGTPVGTEQGRAIWQAMVDRSVLVRDCSSWPRLDGCLRVTIGTPDEDDRFVDALRAALVSVLAHDIDELPQEQP